MFFRKFSTAALLLFCMTAAAQVDTVLQYPEPAPAPAKAWKIERLYFQEDYKGTGHGLVKVPAANWGASLEFRAASVQVVGKDSLLFKFSTSGNWSDTLELGKCNATDLPGTVTHIARKETTRSQDIGKKWFGWEVLVAWPWDTAYTERQKPFAFFFTVKREE